MKQPIVINGRRIYNQETFNRKLKLMAIGLGPKYFTRQVTKSRKIVNLGNTYMKGSGSVSLAA
jgi:hypothetical protein